MNDLSAISDEELLVQVKDGHLSAFGVLYDRYWNPMLAKAYIRLKSQEDAEEVVQELFIKLWRRRDKIELKYTFKTYLYAALRYEILDFVATQTYLKNNLSTEETDVFNFAAQNDSHTSLEMKEFQQQINKIIDNLPEKCQLIFKMSRNEGFKTLEIAKHLNLSPRTVETQISKAIKTLRSALKNLNFILF
jgi:RNA polymerase sigma-70 factor (family 1)